jgi:hypothetical protein
MRQGVIALLLLFSSLTFSQDLSKLHISVKELPPEPFPVGTCKADESGYLGITKAKKEETRLTDKQLGEYVRVRLSQGYSVALYPQVSGKVFAIATCESAKR